MNSDAALQIRKMKPEDIPLGMRLKEIAGWNQVRADWESFLLLEPDGCFVAEIEGVGAGTATTINYENRFGWIGMVIVDPEFRRRGIATRLVEHAIGCLESIDCGCQKLDATDAGALVYQNLGFTIEYDVQRWYREPGPVTDRPLQIADIRPWVTTDLDRIRDRDTTAFGASRRRLLQWYSTNGSPAFIAGNSQHSRGYVVGRAGSRACQMGPLVAADAECAGALMSEFLSSLPEGPVIADIVADNAEAVRLLESLGFSCRRILKRMYRGENRWPGNPRQTFCLAGFEFG